MEYRDIVSTLDPCRACMCAIKSYSQRATFLRTQTPHTLIGMGSLRQSVVFAILKLGISESMYTFLWTWISDSGSYTTPIIF